MKTLLEKIIRKRNPAFRFDAAISNNMLISFFTSQTTALIRGFSLLLRGRNSKRMLMARGVRFHFLKHIQWGSYLKLGEGVVISGLGKNGVQLGDRVSVGAYSRLIVATTLNHLGEGIFIGNNVGIGEFAYLGGAGGLTIGDNCIVGQSFSCHPENHLCDDTTELIRHQGVTRKGIRIGNNCWIGSKVTVLDGVQLGDGCVVAAGAVVTKSFPPNSIIGGVPAKVLRKRGGATIQDFIHQQKIQ